MFTVLALAIGFVIAFQVDRWNAADRKRVEKWGPASCTAGKTSSSSRFYWARSS